MSNHLRFSLLLYSNNILMIFLIGSRFDSQFPAVLPFILRCQRQLIPPFLLKFIDSSWNKSRYWTLRCINLYVILLTTIKSIGNSSERKEKQNRTLYLKVFFSVSIQFLWFLFFMIVTQEGFKMIKTITWRLSIFRKEKITSTKRTFKKLMKILLNEILQLWYDATIVGILHFNCISTFKCLKSTIVFENAM